MDSSALVATIKQIFYWPLYKTFTQTIFTPAFGIGLFLILFLEKIIPAEKRKKLLTVSMANDFIWFLMESVSQAIILSSYVYFLETIYKNHLSFLTIPYITRQQEWIQIIIGVVVVDFLFWFQHVLQHKIPVLWQFHAVHHAQRSINLFTSFRYHIVEYIVRNTLVTLPLMMLSINTANIAFFVVFQDWFARFYHSNIKTNLGLLRYLLVTPQSHRIHHSIESKHRDRNFGSIFSVWDYLFRTQYRGYEEYPQTGIDDHSFPHEETAKLHRLVLTPLKQTLYPFRQLLKK